MTSLLEIEGIGEASAAKLKVAGVRSLEALLEAGKTPKGRKELAEKSGIDESRLLKWVNMADLFRIKGVAEEYSELLEASGVDTVPELAQRNANNLYEKLASVNAEKKLVRKMPTQTEVTKWVEQAKSLGRVIEY